MILLGTIKRKKSGKEERSSRLRIIGFFLEEEVRGALLFDEHALLRVRELEAVPPCAAPLEVSGNKIRGNLELAEALGPGDTMPRGAKALDVIGQFLQELSLLVHPNGGLDHRGSVAREELLAHGDELDSAKEATNHTLHLGGRLFPPDPPGLLVAGHLLPHLHHRGNQGDRLLLDHEFFAFLLWHYFDIEVFLLC